MPAMSLFLAAALAQAAAAVPEPYRCYVPIEVDGLRGGMWRDFAPERPDDFYILQLLDSGSGNGPLAIWSIDNRPAAPPRRYDYRVGRPEAQIFSQGPDYVGFGPILYGQLRDGPVWVRLFGDGIEAGTWMEQSARATRRAFRRGANGLWFSVSQRDRPDIVARLANAREWRAVLLDQAGRELGRKSVRVPPPARIRAVFESARAALLNHRSAFLAARPTAGAAVAGPCSFFEPDEATI